MRLAGADLSSQPFIRAARQTGQPQISNLITDTVASRPLIFFVVPVKDKTGAVLGLIGGAEDPGSLPILGTIQTMASESHEGYIQVVDANGMVLSHSASEHLFQRVDHPDIVLALIAANQPGVISRAVEEESRGQFSEIIAFAPSQATPWGVFVEQSEAEALAPIYAMQPWLIRVCGGRDSELGIG